MTLGRMARLAGLVLVLASTGCATGRMPPPPSPTPLPESVLPTPSDPPPPSVLPSPTPSPPLAARVNGQPVYLADYQMELDRYKASLIAQGIDLESEEGQTRLTESRDQILDALIEQALIEQDAARTGVTVSDARVKQQLQEMADETGGEEALLAKLAEWGETYESTHATVRAQLLGTTMVERAVSAVPESAEHVRAQHILVDTAEKARQLRAQLENGVDFATLATQHSQDSTTRDYGGDLGYFPRGVLAISEVEEAAFSLQPGEISDVVASRLGYHIVLVAEREPDRPIAVDDLQVLREQAVKEWVENLWDQADIERFVERSG